MGIQPARCYLAVLLIVVCRFTNASNDVYKLVGDNLRLDCASEGSIVIVWKLNNQTLTEDETLKTQSASSSGRTESFLMKTSLVTNDTGDYTCSNGAIVLNTSKVHVFSITGEDAVLTKNESSIQLRCTVDASVRELKWTKGEQELDNNTDSAGVPKYTLENNGTALNINNPGIADAGQYTCDVALDGIEKQRFQRLVHLKAAPHVETIDKLRSRVEDEMAVIECKFTGYPVPNITWYRRLEGDGTEDKGQVIKYDDRINATLNVSVPHSKLTIKSLKIKDDQAYYTCEASNDLGVNSTTVFLKVRDKLAAVWPFLGICAEVAILCAIIFIFEKRRNKRMEEEEEVDAVKQELMSHSNGESQEVRQRQNAVKS